MPLAEVEGTRTLLDGQGSTALSPEEEKVGGEDEIPGKRLFMWCAAGSGRPVGSPGIFFIFGDFPSASGFKGDLLWGSLASTEEVGRETYTGCFSQHRIT